MKEKKTAEELRDLIIQQLKNLFTRNASKLSGSADQRVSTGTGDVFECMGDLVAIGIGLHAATSRGRFPIHEVYEAQTLGSQIARSQDGRSSQTAHGLLNVSQLSAIVGSAPEIASALRPQLL